MINKINVSILLICIFGIYWMSRTTVLDEANEYYSSEESIPDLLEDTTTDYIDFNPPETTITTEPELLHEISDFNSCLLTSEKTDALTFSEAFGYYRKCRGTENNFSWKGIEYTTLHLDEIVIKAIDSIAVKSENLNSEVSDIR